MKAAGDEDGGPTPKRPRLDSSLMGPLADLLGAYMDTPGKIRYGESKVKNTAVLPDELIRHRDVLLGLQGLMERDGKKPSSIAHNLMSKALVIVARRKQQQWNMQ
eukprot:10316270-Alexandrium_andersonii.AAC.1